MAKRTIVNMLETSAQKFAQNTYMMEKRDGKYVGATFAETRELVHQFGAGLMSLGVKKGDRIGLISEGRNAWIVSELGILYNGAIDVPISVKVDELNELKFRLSHSGCKMVIVSGNQAHKVLAVRNDLPELIKIISLDPLEETNPDIILYKEVLEMGQKYLETNGKDFEERYQSVDEGDIANICYTSGTTADPKGIMLTHRNYTANVEQAVSLLKIPPTFVTLLILPWDHSFAHTAGIYILMYTGACLAAVEVGKTPLETLKNIPQNIREVRPHFLYSVPALAQNFRKNIERGIRQKGPKVEKLFQSALKNAYAYNADGFSRGKGLRKLRKPLLWLHDKILFSKVREGFGGRLEFFIGGGALLDIELQRFFYALGIPMLQGYGLTEAAPVISANVPQRHKLGSSGTPVPNMEIKICDENGQEVPLGEKGEIVVKGENVMVGYWKNEKATNETIKDGWLHTGDIGYLDKDGFLFVLGREKSLLISHDGEKFSPEGIEEAITAHSPYIDQMMLYNNQSPYTIALIVPNREQVSAFLKEKGLDCHTEEGQKAALELFQKEIDVFKESGEFPTKWLPATFAVLGEGFTEQNRFLNSTLKMVRSRIAEYYKDRMDYLFTPEGKDIFNHQNKTIISRMEE